VLVPYCNKSDYKVCREGRCSLQWRWRRNVGHTNMWSKKDVVYPHTLSEDEYRREKKRTRSVVKKINVLNVELGSSWDGVLEYLA